ncbi:hypothetical protein CLV92_10311 [Kineococcus xinjiangensis]|uniref:Uncharacterized protein n=2 Tax=Kineococcus xinjiangensis TaxID=512762 RepID=A0A2S6ITJ1_9ACTN|nr:hypothetical protein CLV92_10311 [Kineococcus xinjiangensis]
MDEQVCRRCSRPVSAPARDYEIFEQMHYVCFHYEFEHDMGSGATDVDSDCGIPGCPSGLMPPVSPSSDAQQALRDITEALRDPYSPDAWRVEPHGPAELTMIRHGRSIRVIVADVPPEQS